VPAETETSDGFDEKPHSRWRLHLGNRPSDVDGAMGNAPSVPR
jgi:hypothetical protein